ncbi:MAG: hypothetical protein AAGA45_07590 [Verrucomicrobiota bacterium]
MKPEWIEDLRRISQSPAPLNYSSKCLSLQQKAMLLELKRGGLIDCVLREDGNGVPSDFGKITITALGVEYLAKNEAEANADKVGNIRVPAWYQRPAGTVAITVIAGIILALALWGISRLFDIDLG